MANCCGCLRRSVPRAPTPVPTTVTTPPTTTTTTTAAAAPATTSPTLAKAEPPAPTVVHIPAAVTVTTRTGGAGPAVLEGERGSEHRRCCFTTFPPSSGRGSANSKAFIA
eukprot:jgi/Chlat1/2048/Chrsp17S02768